MERCVDHDWKAAFQFDVDKGSTATTPVAKVEDFKWHVILYETDLDDLERKSKALTDDEENDNRCKHKDTLLLPPLQLRALPPITVLLLTFW